ncbi:MAG: H-X9-DG-CTERM domain-containing protein [Candidatus Zipacnadales bacterium]
MVGDSAGGRYYIYWSDTLPNERYLDKRHNDGANLLYADGHTKWRKTTQRREWTVRSDD